MIELTIALLGQQHREATRAVLSFFGFALAERTDKLALFQNAIDAVMQQLGVSFVDAVLHAMAQTTPSFLYVHLADLWFGFLTSFTDAKVHALVLERLQSHAAALGGDALTLQDRELVVRLWVRFTAGDAAGTRSAKAQFRSVCKDFAQVCRRELTADTLRAYEC